jgi:hypothetical protein
VRFFAGMIKGVFGVQRSTFNVQRLAFGVWRLAVQWCSSFVVVLVFDL